jgi:RNA-splicing ligase RtcB
MNQWFINLPDTDLVYLPEGTNDFVDYVEAMGWAEDLTMANRQIMLRATLQAVQWALGSRRETGIVASRAGLARCGTQRCHKSIENRERLGYRRLVRLGLSLVDGDRPSPGG